MGCRGLCSGRQQSVRGGFQQGRMVHGLHSTITSDRDARFIARQKKTLLTCYTSMATRLREHASTPRRQASPLFLGCSCVEPPLSRHTSRKVASGRVTATSQSECLLHINRPSRAALFLHDDRAPVYGSGRFHSAQSTRTLTVTTETGIILSRDPESALRGYHWRDLLRQCSLDLNSNGLTKPLQVSTFRNEA